MKSIDVVLGKTLAVDLVGKQLETQTRGGIADITIHGHHVVGS
ncbi:hypothetical protein ABH547_01615 [Escherichia coli]